MVEVPIHLAPATPPVVYVLIVLERRRRNRDLRDSAPSTGSRHLHMIYRRSPAVSGTAASAAARRRRPRSRRTCCRRSSAGCRHLRGPCCRLVTWLFVVRGCPSVTDVREPGSAAAARGRRQARSRARYGCLACVRGACCARGRRLLPSLRGSAWARNQFLKVERDSRGVATRRERGRGRAGEEILGQNPC